MFVIGPHAGHINTDLNEEIKRDTYFKQFSTHVEVVILVFSCQDLKLHKYGA